MIPLRVSGIAKFLLASDPCSLEVVVHLLLNWMEGTGRVSHLPPQGGLWGLVFFLTFLGRGGKPDLLEI